jgi:hypothetical protein
MAITAENLNTSTFGWIVNATSADLSGAETVKAAPGAGLNLYLTHISINCATAITVTVGSGETGSAVDTPIVGPVTFTTGGGQYQVTFDPPLLVDANTALTADASGSGATQITAQGHTK